MNLTNKKLLASKVLGVGMGRIRFSKDNLSEIKEALTRQDIIDLKNAGIISIREEKGRKKREKVKKRKGIGKRRRKVKQDKNDYMIITRKLRTFAKFLLKTGKIDIEKYRKIRKMIRTKRFKSKRHLEESLEEI